MIDNELYRKYLVLMPSYFPAIMHITELKKVNKELLVASKKTYTIKQYKDNKVIKHFFYKSISMLKRYE